jgi:hypothetical protein
MSEQGFIALSRGLPDHPIVGFRGKYKESEAWQWLLFEAAYTDRLYRAGSIVVQLKRGQVAHSTRFMAKAWGWSEAKVRRFLTCLKKGAMIDAAADAGVTVISICNYDKYQSAGGNYDAASDAATDAEATQQRRRKEQGNKVTRETTRSRADEPDGFAEWYEAYPRKKQRNDAAKAYRKIVPKEITHADLFARTVAFAEFHRTNTPRHRWQFVPYPASWLNSGEYLDGPNETSKTGAHEIRIEQPTRDPKAFTDTEWRDRLTDYQNGQAWPDLFWGLPPGKPGCLVPARLLIESAPRPPLAAGGGG